MAFWAVGTCAKTVTTGTGKVGRRGPGKGGDLNLHGTMVHAFLSYKVLCCAVLSHV